MPTITFPEVKIRREFKIKCPNCGKSRNKIISRSYFRNGFHNEQETRVKLTAQLDPEQKDLGTTGLICNKCENEGKPRQWTVRDLQIGDEIVGYRKVARITKIHLEGSRWISTEQEPEQITDPRCGGYGIAREPVRYTRDIKALSLDEFLSHGESIWRDGVKIYPVEVQP